MIVFRIEREKYLSTTLKGIGAANSKGFRWNSLNTFLVYTAESRALALLEIAVHLDINEDLPNDRYLVEIEIPEDVEISELKKDNLPSDWNSKPPTTATQFIGDDFVWSGETAVLKVPSSIIPDEYNYLINPQHPDAKKLKVISTKNLKIDNRLKK